MSINNKAPLVGGSGNVVNYGAFGTVAAGAVIVDRSECKAVCVFAPILINFPFPPYATRESEVAVDVNEEDIEF